MATRPTGLALLLVHVVVLLTGSAVAQDPEKPPETPPETPAPAPQEPAPETPKVDVEDLAARAGVGNPDESAVALTWRDRLARDKQVTFTPRSATDASAALDLRGGTSLRRAAAWVTLGCVGSPADRPRIEGQARTGKGLQRQAAILALGEISADETALLASFAEEPDVQSSEAAMLALLRSRRPAGAERVEGIAHLTSDPRAATAAALLAFQRDPSLENVPRAARLWVDLRWEAARVFGGVDGQSFSVRRIDKLAASPAFVSEVVLRAGARLPGIAPKDHLLLILLEGSSPARLVAAVDASPRALSRLVDSGLWAPRDAGEWEVLLAEIERERAEASCPELLLRAQDVLELRWRAKALLARADRVDIESFGAIDVPALEEKDRVLACQVLGSIADPASRAILAHLAEDASPAVRGTALAARFRLGDKSVAAAMDPIEEDRTRPEHAPLLESLCRNVREPLVAFRLEKYLRKAVGAELATVAAALCEQGRSSGRTVVRSLLSLDSPPIGARRRLLVRALCRRPTAEDHEALAQTFPQPGEDDLNGELAVGLTLLGDPGIHPILRSALWSSGFDLEHPPSNARDGDLRRAGFALGEWGGIEALDALMAQAGSKGSPAVQGALLGVLGARTQ